MCELIKATAGFQGQWKFQIPLHPRKGKPSMPSMAFLAKTLYVLCSRMLFRKLKKPCGVHKSPGSSFATKQKLQRYASLVCRSDLSRYTLMFDVEGCLLKSSSLFAYFMLVAFEAGGLLRAVVLFSLYPLIWLVGSEVGLRIMVMVCFLGVKEESFRVGRTVLPKFYLEDVGLEIFEVVKKGKRRVAVSDMPQVMIESFLADYLEIEHVFGKRVKTFRGYYVGVVEQKRLEEIVDDSSDVIGICGVDKGLKSELFRGCKEIYVVGEADKRGWGLLPRGGYPKPLVFHDGRLAMRPSPMNSVAILTWAPFGMLVAMARIIVCTSFPRKLSYPLLAFSGIRLVVKKPRAGGSETETPKAVLYVCNHRTLLDPLYLSSAVDRNLTAVVYSVSRFTEAVSPIKTVRLSRKRVEDAKVIQKLLSEGDLVIFPEGTTCREPYLLRFSALFAEIADEVVPVGVDVETGMFYATTAGGHKCLDPLFFSLNPSPLYTLHLLTKLSIPRSNWDPQRSSYDFANCIQNMIAQALGFHCTLLTRRDKYLILAGNDGAANQT